MSIATDRLEFAPPAPPGLIRALLLAILAHSLLLAALTWGVQWKREAQIVSFEAELWSALPTPAAPPAPEPEPEPAPPPPEPIPVALPPPPRPKPVPVPEPAPPVKLPQVDIALQQEKLRLKKQEEKRLEAQRQEKRKQEQQQLLQEQARQDKLKQNKLKQEKLAQEKQEKLAQEKLRQAQADKAEKANQAALEKKKDEQAAKQLQAQRADNIARSMRMANSSSGNGSPDSTGKAQKSTGPSASYPGRIRGRIKPNIVFTEDIAGNPTAEVEVRTSPDGTIVGRRLLKSSGVASWDEAVLKAIDKTQELPRDIDGTMPTPLVLVFRLKD